MSDIIVTAYEAEEFISQVTARPTLWLGRDKLWVRRYEHENLVAVKLVNGVPHEQYTVHVVPYDGRSQDAAERYVERLFYTLTSYGPRKRMQTYLRRKLHALGLNPPQDTIERMAREICEDFIYSEEAPTEVHEPLVEVRQPVELRQSVVVEEAKAPHAIPPTPVTPSSPPKRSRHLENLLRGRT